MDGSFVTVLTHNFKVFFFPLRVFEEKLVRKETQAPLVLLDLLVQEDPLEMMVPKETLYVGTHTHTHTCSAMTNTSLELSAAWLCQVSELPTDLLLMSVKHASQSYCCLNVSAGSSRLPWRPWSSRRARYCCKCWLYALVVWVSFRMRVCIAEIQ